MESRHSRVVRQMEKLFWIRRIALRRAMEGLSLYPGQLHVLEYISQRPGCTQADIAEMLLVTPSSIAQSTKRMQRDGLLEKRRQKDNRRWGLVLTDKGEEVALRCREAFNAADEDLFGELSDEELALLETYIERLMYRAAKQTALDPERMDFYAFMKMKKEWCRHREGQQG